MLRYRYCFVKPDLLLSKYMSLYISYIRSSEYRYHPFLLNNSHFKDKPDAKMLCKLWVSQFWEPLEFLGIPWNSVGHQITVLWRMGQMYSLNYLWMMIRIWNEYVAIRAQIVFWWHLWNFINTMYHMHFGFAYFANIVCSMEFHMEIHWPTDIRGTAFTFQNTQQTMSDRRVLMIFVITEWIVKMKISTKFWHESQWKFGRKLWIMVSVFWVVTRVIDRQWEMILK